MRVLDPTLPRIKVIKVFGITICVIENLTDS